jgi:membrane fusion protein, multidrug efflux system
MIDTFFIENLRASQYRNNPPSIEESMVRNTLITTVVVVLSFLGLSCQQQAARTELDIAAPVTVRAVALNNIEQFVTTTGTVEATQTYDIKSEQAGEYHLQTNPRTKQTFAEGDQVKKDDVLVKLVSRDLEISVNLESKKLSLDLADLQYKAQQQLFEKGGVTQKDVTTAQQSLINAQLSYESGQTQLDKLNIRPPFDGFLTDVTYITPGIKIASGAAIATVKNYSRLTMEVTFPAKQSAAIHEGLETRITNVNIPNTIFHGRITEVTPTLDPTTRAFSATIVIDNPGLELKPGMFVKVDVVVEHHENVVVIPKSVVITQRQSKTVFVVDRGVAVQRQITTGLEDPTNVEVLQGLSENDRLVIRGFETLRDRAKVKVTE